MLTTTQDKALQRINKMKAEKKELVERIKELEVGKDSASVSFLCINFKINII